MLILHDFHFLRPFWLIAIPIFCWLIFTSYKKWLINGNWENLIDPNILNFLSTQPKSNIKKFLPWLLCIIITLLLLALAGPVWKKKPQPIFKKSQSRIILLDLSYSMFATDIKPTRIDRVRFKLVDLLKKFTEGETGLICYAGDAFVISPLTHDPATLISLLPGLNPDIMPVPGSNPERAFELALEMIERSMVNNGHIIWVTDGLEEESISKLNKIIGSNKLSIFAVGTESGSPIALTGGGFLKNDNGVIVIPKMKIKPLKKLAELSNGSLSILSLNDNDIEKIVSSESTTLDFVKDKQQRTTDKWEEEGPWLLLLALPLSAFLFRRGLLFSIFILATMSLIPNNLKAFDWDDLWLKDDQKAEKMFNEGKMDEAFEMFNDKEWKGVSAYRAGDYKNAIKKFSELDTPRARFNMANSMAKSGLLNESLDVYNKILKNNPKHEDAKFNKELIEKMMKEQQKKNNENKNNQKGKDAFPVRKSKKDSKEVKNKLEDQNFKSKKEELNISKNNNINKKSSEKFSSENENLNKNKDKKINNAKKNNKIKSDEKPNDNNITNEEQDINQETRSKNQVLEQWLRKIPDDPGRLLRNKMHLEFKRRGSSNQQNKNYW